MQSLLGSGGLWTLRRELSLAAGFAGCASSGERCVVCRSDEHASSASLPLVAQLGLVAVVSRWHRDFGLTRAEGELLGLAASGCVAAEIQQQRGVTRSTHKTLVSRLLSKTGHDSMLSIVAALLREVLVLVGLGPALCAPSVAGRCTRQRARRVVLRMGRARVAAAKRRWRRKVRA